jgi:hypothetical protein
MRRILLLVAVVLIGFLVWGCSQSGPMDDQAKSRSDNRREGDGTISVRQGDGSVRPPPDEHAVVLGGRDEAAVANPQVPEPAGGKPAQAQAQPLSRKIIYNADVKVVVPDLSAAEQQLLQLVHDLNGFVAQSEIIGAAGSPRQGHWRLRVPADQVQACVAAIAKLGIPEKNGVDSKDVTEEYYDLEARIKNKKVEEGRLQGYLDDKKATSKLEDILTIERLRRQETPEKPGFLHFS